MLVICFNKRILPRIGDSGLNDFPILKLSNDCIELSSRVVHICA